MWTSWRSRCQNRAQRAAYDAISVSGSASQMPRSPMRTQRNTYTAYSMGCAGVWGVILLLGRRRLDSQTWNMLRLVCSGWWMGWTSATIARIGYPPPEQLTSAGEKRGPSAFLVGSVRCGWESVGLLIHDHGTPHARSRPVFRCAWS